MNNATERIDIDCFRFYRSAGKKAPDDPMGFGINRHGLESMYSATDAIFPEGGDVINKYLKIILLLVLLMLGAIINAFAFFGIGDSVHWKEEVLLHDGRTIVAKRSLIYGGRHETGQQAPIKEQTILFALPDSGKIVSWKSEYSEDVGRANFNLLAVHILNDIPYIVANPNLCLAYNKWGRPNPPYVLFKYDGNAWHRISMDEFPVEFKDINLTLTPKTHEKTLLEPGTVSIDKVKQLNSDLTQPYLKSIVRTPLEPGSIGVSCEVMINYKCFDVHMGWGAPGDFNKQYFDRKCEQMMRGR